MFALRHKATGTFMPDKKGGAGWLEWGGCGMVNPNVLKSAGLDPGTCGVPRRRRADGSRT